MDLRLLCDVVYVLMVERLERLTNAVAGGFAGAGAEGAWELPDKIRDEFDTSLNAPMVAETLSDTELALRRLGVA